MRKLQLRRDVQGKLARGIRLQELGETAEAARLYRRIIRADPRNSDALHLLALLYETWGDIERAIKLLRAAITFQDVPKAPYNANLANCLHKLSRFDEAIEQYRLAISIDPAFDHPRLNLAISLRQSATKRVPRKRSKRRCNLARIAATFVSKSDHSACRTVVSTKPKNCSSGRPN